MIMPYLRFNGNCEEAFTWYANIFDGHIQHLSKYNELSNAPTSNQQGQVMHAQLLLNETDAISGSDTLEPLTSGNTLAIQLHLASVTKAKAIFKALSVDGVVLAPLAANPPPDDAGCSGAVIDKYGYTWILSAIG